MHYTSNKNAGSKHQEIGFFVISLLLHLQYKLSSSHCTLIYIFVFRSDQRTTDNLQNYGTKNRRPHHLLRRCPKELQFSAKAPDKPESIMRNLFLFMHELVCRDYSEYTFFCSCSALFGEQLCELQESPHKPFKAVGGLTWHLPHLY